MMKKKIALLTASAVLIAASVLGCRQNTGEPDPNFVSVQPPSSGSEPSPQRVEGIEGIKVIEGESTLSQTSSLSGSSESETVGGLPKLIPWQRYLFGGGGGEDYIVADVEDLKSANPWTGDAELKTLPVYQNVYVSSEDIPESVRMTEGLTGRRASQEEMEAAARAVAQELNVEVSSVELFPSEELIQRFKTQKGEVPKEYQYVNSVTLNCGGGEISIEADTELNIHISFEPGLVLPEEYALKPDASYEEQIKRGEYLIEQYSKLLHMEKPVLNIDRKRSFEGMSFCSVYEGAGDLTQQLVNYSMNTADFTFFSEGELAGIRLYRRDISEKIGDYPIITAEQAQEKLAAGGYIGGAAAQFPGEEHIVHTELVYPTDQVLWMPYYRFYAEIGFDQLSYPPETEAEKISRDGRPLKAYAAFYVPAIEDGYLERMPDINGRFN